MEVKFSIYLNGRGFVMVRLTHIGQLGLISERHKNFQNFRKGLSYHKGPESINYTIVKLGEMFDGRNTALTKAN